jgi:hypothetical protein
MAVQDGLQSKTEDRSRGKIAPIPRRYVPRASASAYRSRSRAAIRQGSFRMVRKGAGRGELDPTQRHSCGCACRRRRAEVEAASGADDGVLNGIVVVRPFDGVADMDGEDLPLAAVERGGRIGKVPLDGHDGALVRGARRAGVGAAPAAAGGSGAAA